jgi:hypothetical protein
MKWCIVIDPYEGTDSVIGPFDTLEDTQHAADLIYALSGDCGTTIARIYPAPVIV